MIIAISVVTIGSKRAAALSTRCRVGAVTAFKTTPYLAPGLLAICGPFATPAAARDDRYGLGQCIGKPIIDNS